MGRVRYRRQQWPKTPLVGGVMTGLFNLAVPAFMLAFQVAAQSYKPLYDLIERLASNSSSSGPWSAQASSTSACNLLTGLWFTRK